MSFSWISLTLQLNGDQKDTREESLNTGTFKFVGLAHLPKVASL
jgi:hypothetical protein